MAICTHYQGVCDHLVCPRAEARVKAETAAIDARLVAENKRHRASEKKRQRVTLYFVVTTTDEPLQNMWDWNERRLDRLVRDRAANGDGLFGERVVRGTVRFYDALLERYGLPPRTSEPGER